MTTGERMKQLRKNLGFSAENVADALNVSPATIYRYEKGDIEKVPGEILEPLAKLLRTSPAYLMGWTEKDNSNILPYVRGRRLPIIGSIPAGVPVLAEQNIEGYDYADVPEGEEYFFLRVKGDSMINAGINNGDLALVKSQNCAENGNVVVCIVNGDEATLKRFHYKNDVVVLQPENSAYAPLIVPCKDFENGYARIVGVAKEVRHCL